MFSAARQPLTLRAWLAVPQPSNGRLLRVSPQSGWRPRPRCCLRASAASASAELPLRKRWPWSNFRGVPAAHVLSALVAWSAYTRLRGRRTFCFTAVLVSRLALLLNSVMFASLGRQADGLMGPDGISPLVTSTDTEQGPSWWDSLLLRHLQCARPGHTARLCAIAAILSCFLPVCAVSGLAVGLILVWLSVVYRGYMHVDFLHYQWDALALELSALAAVAAMASIPRSCVVREGCAALSMHCFALLGFKLMWGSCLCKLFSNCPEWNFGTAMEHHHRTTCLPKPFARTLHRWSRSSPRFSQAQVKATLWSEGPFSFLALLGWPWGRILCALLWCLLMLTIAASGNYGVLPATHYQRSLLICRVRGVSQSRACSETRSDDWI